jgi:hypothetical protein
LNDGSVKTGEKLTSKLWRDDASVNMNALSALVVLCGEGIRFSGSGQKTGEEDRLTIKALVRSKRAKV